MKVAVFYPKNFFASWYALGGYVSALRDLGHEVIDCPVPGNLVRDVAVFRRVLPSLELLLTCDVVLSTFHEYLHPWLEAVYGFEAWQQLLAAGKVIARYDESMDRVDLKLPERLPELRRWANYHSFPAAQDALRYDGAWHPFGTDTRIFRPTRTEKKYDVAFIGTMYQLRQNYLRQLVSFISSDVIFCCGSCMIQDLSGVKARESTELLAENYRQIKIFFCLPPMSRLIVAKVVDVMACGTFVMYPRLPGGSHRNNVLFKHHEHLAYYDLGYFKVNGKQVHHWLEHEAEREQIAAAGGELVRAEHTLPGMLEKILALATPRVTLPVAVEAVPA